MANEWFRLWHDMPTDPKWKTIARVSGQPISVVIAVAMHYMTSASRSVTRGHVDVTTEDVASALDVTDEVVDAIYKAMQGRFMDGNRLINWDKRQPKKEDAGNPETRAKSAAERKREQRERERQAAEEAMSRASHDESRGVTTDKDKDKEEKEETIMSGKPDVDQPEAPEPKLVKATNAQAREILAYLNARTGCDYRDVESNLSLIRARIDEGYSVQEVKAVIDDREAKWRGNDKMWPYMRPETLFGARKFSGYVGQVKPTAPGAGWWIKAGFGTPFEAENAGCSEKTAYLWQDGHRLEVTA